jgi:hypothetical protein
MWHSEDYYQNFPEVLEDKTFILTNVFMLGILLLLISPFSGETALAIGLICFCFAPLVLSAKRIVRYKVGKISFKKLVSVYLVDIFYLLGRVLGSLRSMRKLIIPDGNRKYERR